MPTKQQITTIGVLGLIALGLGYWSGMPEKDSGQRAEVVAPTVITNVVTNILKEAVTNIVRVPTQQPARQKAKRPPAKEIGGGLPPSEAGDRVGQIVSYDPKFNFYVVNRGAHHGIKTGDEYNVIRAGNLVGKIKIQKADPTASFAVAVKAFTPQRLENQDVVIKTNIVTANVMNPIVEKAIRKHYNKPTGELTKADLEKVTRLDLEHNQLTDVKGLEKLTQLERLDLYYNQLTDVKGLENLTQLEVLDLRGNPDLTKAQIAELQKALPKCKIYSNPTK